MTAAATPDDDIPHDLHRVRVPGWPGELGSPVAFVEEMATGHTTARFNRVQRGALRAVLALLYHRDAQLRRRDAELVAVHAERKRVVKELRIALDAMRKERDRERKRGDVLERRRPCGKVPLRDAEEAGFFLAVVCRRKGEHEADWMTYECTRCPPMRYGPVHHIAHTVPRADRSTTPLSTALGAALDDDTATRLRAAAG